MLKCKLTGCRRPAPGVVGAGVAALILTMRIGIAAAAPPDQPDSQSAVRVELGTTKRDCDFHPVSGPDISTTAATAPTRHSGGGGFALISSAEGSVNAEIHLLNAAPTTSYTVWLIELPSATCSPGAPGVAVTAVQTDPVGNGTATLQTDVVPGATGAWVAILDGSGQVYTSNTVAGSDFAKNTSMHGLSRVVIQGSSVALQGSLGSPRAPAQCPCVNIMF